MYVIIIIFLIVSTLLTIAALDYVGIELFLEMKKRKKERQEEISKE